MATSIISEGKTTSEAIENGLNKLKVSKDMVDVKVLENEDKRSFFSILTPRVVKVELTVKENTASKAYKPKEVKEEIKLTDEEYKIAEQNLEAFLKDFAKKLPQGTEYSIEKDDLGIEVKINNSQIGYLIGYRGETLYALQTILSSIANKGIEKRVRVLLDIEGYKKKRIKTLEELAEKIARNVVKTGKPVTLEPMQAYERKIIHNKLQENKKVTTTSIGEEPRRRIVVSLK